MKKSVDRRASLSIVIPCLNEVGTLEKAIKQARQSAQRYTRAFEIIVVDNGSTDGSLEKLRQLQKKKMVRVLLVPVKGYGSALHHGILAAKYPYVLYADADLSYDFRDLQYFLPFQKEHYDLVLGSRLSGTIEQDAMPFLHHYVGTPVLSLCIRLLYRLPITDSNSGMRMIRKKFYQRLRMKYRGMEWASEILIRAALLHVKYAEVPIHFRKDKRGKKPHLKRWSDGWRHLKVIILLGPAVLLVAATMLFLSALILIPFSLFTTIALGLFSEFLILSFLLVKKLDAVLSLRNNVASRLLDRIPLVSIGVVINTIGISSIFLISDAHLFSKYILVFQVVIYDLWLFFVETINTDLANVLVEKKYFRK